MKGKRHFYEDENKNDQDNNIRLLPLISHHIFNSDDSKIDKLTCPSYTLLFS